MKDIPLIKAFLDEQEMNGMLILILSFVPLEAVKGQLIRV